MRLIYSYDKKPDIRCFLCAYVFDSLSNIFTQNASESRGSTLTSCIKGLCDLIAIYCCGEICLYFQIISLTETKWTDWFKPVSIQTPLHWETSSISGHNCFLWHVAGKTHSITFKRERAVTLSAVGWCADTTPPDRVHNQNLQRLKYIIYNKLIKWRRR